MVTVRYVRLADFVFLFGYKQKANKELAISLKTGRI
jgi:hypothetical protein